MGQSADAARDTAGATSPDARVAALLARHGGALMRVARQASLCHDDAADALQRALEIYLRRIDTVERATEAAWLKVVVRHEAYAIRRSRGDCVADPDLDLDAFVPAPGRSVEEQVLSGDRVSRSAEALRALKPDEARALMLKAHGLSYEEIGRHCGWTYTKVNRCITEGRRRFMDVYAALETGDTCTSFGPALEALVAGRATSEQLVELRPHLRACTACRATVRELHRGKGLSVLAPIPLVGWLLDRFGGRRGGSVSDLAGVHVPEVSLPQVPDLAGPAAGGVPVQPIPTGERIGALGRVKQDVTQLLHRTGNADLTTAIQIAATTGGGRAATIGAIVGLCLSGLGAGAVCVVTGVVEDPLGLLRPQPKAARPHPSHAAKPPRAASPPALVATRRPPVGTPTPSPMRRTRGSVRHRADPAQGRRPTSHEHAPISPPPPAAKSEFAAAPAAGAGANTAAAAAPATGGGEFGP